jgi:creatinine amidohydrolase/Fe(II)-dependent formamide hydrolase-like protein
MLHLRPDLVRNDELRDDPDRTVGRVFSYRVDQTSAEGHTGAPTTATAAAGAALFEEIVAALAAIATAARREEAPALPDPALAPRA